MLVAASSYADKLRALDGLQAIYAARPSRVVVGTLELQVDFGRVQVAADQLKRLNGMIKYTVTGTAIPATFACTYGGGTGLVQGIPVDTQRVNEAATLATVSSGVGTITCLGDVPTPAVLTIQGAASTVYYLATSATGRRVPIATDANGVGRIDERAGLYLVPGVNRITAYSAATGTTTLTTITVMSFFGTTWRYSGNAASGTATRFDIGPAMTVNRPGSATYWTGTTIAYALNDEPRIGFVATGTGNGGLVLEGTATNRLLQSENFGTTWTLSGATRVTSAIVDPAGTTNAWQIQATSAYGQIRQTITAPSTNRMTFSVWLKASTTGTSAFLDMYDTGGPTNIGTLIISNLSTNWTRYSVTTNVNVTSGANLRFEIGTANIGDNFLVWGAQVEEGTAATSYIPTTTVSATRLPDVAGLTSPHNLALYSDTQTNAAWAVTGWSVATTPVAGPVASLLNAYRVTTTATSADNLRQDVTIAGGQAGGKVYTFSVWLRQQATTTSVVLHIENQAGTSRGQSGSGGNYSISLSSTWTRYWVTATMDASDTGAIVKIRTANAAGTIDVYGAQLTEGYLPGRYIRTTDTNILPVQMIDASWSQNGYIEADFQWEYNASISTAQYMFGDSTGTASGAIRLDVGGSSTNTMRFLRYYAAGTQVSVSFTDAPFSTGESGRVRMEWTNFLLGGSRYMYLRIYTITGGITTLRSETNFAGTVGSSWSALDVTRLSRIGSGGGWQGTISNLVIGTPSLPEGSQAAGI